MDKSHATIRHSADRIPLYIWSNPPLPEKIWNLLQSIQKHVQTLPHEKESIEMVEQWWLTSTDLFIKKIEDLSALMTEFGIKRYVFPVNFWEDAELWISCSRFKEYYDFEEDELDIELWKTTTTFVHSYKSRVNPLIWLLYDEFYEHEDDTDSGQYYTLIQIG